jgi:hypothetical protein
MGTVRRDITVEKIIPKQTGPMPTTPENINMGIRRILAEFNFQIFINALSFPNSSLTLSISTSIILSY